MMLQARVVGITMEGLDDRVDAAADGAGSSFNGPALRPDARQMVGNTQRSAAKGSRMQRR
jgi:hypothetical protein